MCCFGPRPWRQETRTASGTRTRAGSFAAWLRWFQLRQDPMHDTEGLRSGGSATRPRTWRSRACRAMPKARRGVDRAAEAASAARSIRGALAVDTAARSLAWLSHNPGRSRHVGRSCPPRGTEWCYPCGRTCSVEVVAQDLDRYARQLKVAPCLAATYPCQAFAQPCPIIPRCWIAGMPGPGRAPSTMPQSGRSARVHRLGTARLPAAILRTSSRPSATPRERSSSKRRRARGVTTA